MSLFIDLNGFNSSKRVIYRSEIIGLTTFPDFQCLFIAGRTGLLAGRCTRKKRPRENPEEVRSDSCHLLLLTGMSLFPLSKPKQQD